MKLLSSQQIHEWDAYTIEHEPVASIDLMERAARRCTDYIFDQQLIHEHIKIFCGKGNNGGDGLAIARQLIEAGMQPAIFILEFGAKGTEDFQVNLHRLHQLTSEIYFIQSKEFFPEINKNDLVIDALFGSGLNRPLKDLSAELVQHINQFNARVVSIDVPSGMFIDKSSKGNAVIKATYTLTFQSLKLCFLLPENADMFGIVGTLDIGLHPVFLETVDTTLQLITKEQIQSYLKPRTPFSHKGTYGHALLVAGNKGKMGAAVLAARACLRTGVGLLTVSVSEEGLNIMQTAFPEAMCTIRDETVEWKKYSSIGTGPGLGTHDDAKQLVQLILKNYTQPVAIDADALNIIAANKEMLNSIPAGSVLTPHPKEFERVFGAAENDFERIQQALQLSQQYPFIIVLKGHHTFIAHSGKGWFNTTGNAGMATGGTGDVLTGIITSLLAQRYEPLHAALTGVYLHGLAADIALTQQSLQSLLPSDIIRAIGESYNALMQ